MNLQSIPNLAAEYWHAFTRGKPPLDADQLIPRARLRVERVPIGAQHLELFRDFVGSCESFPLCFAYVLAQPAHLHLINQPKFPVRCIGLVHAQNRIVRVSPVDPDQAFTLEIAVVGDQMRRRGREFTIDTEFRQGGTLCLTMRSGYLSRVRGGNLKPKSAVPKAPAQPRALGQALESIPFAGNFGRRYARVSGDYNPIHLGALLARPFGFKRAIAHGIGALARIDAAIGRHQGGATRALGVVFKRPVDLPSSPSLYQSPDLDSYLLLDQNSRELQLVERIAG